MVTFTLKILCRAKETAHRRWSPRPDLSCWIWFQCGSPVYTSQTRWLLQTSAHYERQGLECSGWSQSYIRTKHWGTHGASCCFEILQQDWPSRWVLQYQNRRRLGTTLPLPHTHGILPLQQGDRKSPATMVRAMYEVFKDMVFKDFVIYIEDIIIFLEKYDKHLARLRMVLQWQLDEKFWLKASKCKCFNKRVDILRYILIPNGLHMDPNKCKKYLTSRFPSNCWKLRGILGVVIFRRKFWPELASWSSTL